MEEYRIKQFVDNDTRDKPKPRSCVNGRGDKVSNSKADDCENHGGNKQEPISISEGSGTRQEDQNVDELLIERSSHWATVSRAGEDENRCKSEYQFPKPWVASSVRTRRKSSGEIARKWNKDRRNSPPVPFNITARTKQFHGLIAREVNCVSTSINDEYQDGETSECLGTPSSMSRINSGENLRFPFSRPSKTQRGSLEGRQGSDLKSFELGSGRHANDSLRLQFPAAQKSAHAQLTRIRSLSDSEVVDSVLSAEKREKLERLKSQIYENNLKTKTGRKISGSHASSDKILPRLTEKSVTRCTNGHATAIRNELRYGVTSDTRAYRAFTREGRTSSDLGAKEYLRYSYPSYQYQDPEVNTDGNGTECTDTGASVSGLELRDISTQDAPRSILASRRADSELQEPQQELKKIHFPDSSKHEHQDLESISVIIDRLQNAKRARSDPGDARTRKSSTVQLLNRARSETDSVKFKVQDFVTKPLPALPPNTLRVKKLSLEEVPSKKSFCKSGAHVNTASERLREKKDGVINLHNCPNLNVFSDRSWMYQDKEGKKHRYIRGPATPIPPVHFVFSNKDPDTAPS